MHPFEEPAGGGAVAAVQLARLAGSCDAVHRARRRRAGSAFAAAARRAGGERARHLRRGAAPGGRSRSSTPPASARSRPSARGSTRRAPATAAGGRRSADLDAVYFTAGDEAALRAARAGCARARGEPAGPSCARRGVALDALVLSGEDEIELSGGRPRHEPRRSWSSSPRARGEGATAPGGGEEGSWAAAQLPGAPVDSYGCGDSFAAGAHLRPRGRHADRPRRSRSAPAAGAVCLTGHGPYEHQLRRPGAGSGRDLKGCPARWTSSRSSPRSTRASSRSPSTGPSG